MLEQISFPIGYGVETSHLLDVYKLYGLSAFAQTDLDQRVHMNQATIDLGRMAFGILQTFLSRMKAMGLMSDLPEFQNILRQFQAHNQEFETIEHRIVEEERPPMLTVPEYRKKMGLDGKAKKAEKKPE